jgi:hypothetical protein
MIHTDLFTELLCETAKRNVVSLSDSLQSARYLDEGGHSHPGGRPRDDFRRLCAASGTSGSGCRRTVVLTAHPWPW